MTKTTTTQQQKNKLLKKEGSSSGWASRSTLTTILKKLILHSKERTKPARIACLQNSSMSIVRGLIKTATQHPFSIGPYYQAWSQNYKRDFVKKGSFNHAPYGWYVYWCMYWEQGSLCASSTWCARWPSLITKGDLFIESMIRYFCEQDNTRRVRALLKRFWQFFVSRPDGVLKFALHKARPSSFPQKLGHIIDMRQFCPVSRLRGEAVKVIILCSCLEIK